MAPQFTALPRSFQASVSRIRIAHHGDTSRRQHYGNSIMGIKGKLDRENNLNVKLKCFLTPVRRSDFLVVTRFRHVNPWGDTAELGTLQ